MNNLSIKTRIHGIIGLSLVLALGAIVFLAYEISHVSQQYDHVINIELRKQELTRTLEISLQKQVLDWKNLLLRGHDSDEFEKYKSRLARHELQVQTHRDDLKKSIKSPKIIEQFNLFLDANEKLSEAYRKGLDAYSAKKNADPPTPPSTTKIEDPGIIIPYLLAFALIGGIVGIIAIPSKRGHQD